MEIMKKPMDKLLKIPKKKLKQIFEKRP